MHRDSISFQDGPKQTLRKGISAFAAICLLGTCGYVIAGWNWLDAIYMVTLTVFGVGYGEVQPIDSPGLKLFTVAFIAAGCSSMIYVVGGIVQLIAEGEVQRMLGIHTRSREIDGLSDHTIICGYGRVGQMLAKELLRHDEKVVIVDRNPDRINQAIEDGFLAMEGDAITDESLQLAGIFRAKTLATVLPDDAMNVFITLTARDLCETIRIIARAEMTSTERKLLRSGATRVVMPAAMGAMRIAQLATDDHAIDTMSEDRLRMISKVNRCSDSRDLTRELTRDQCFSQEEVQLAEIQHDVEESMQGIH